MPIERTKNYTRYRIRNPNLFTKSSFRTLDIGKPKKHLLVRARLKRSGKYATQSVLAEHGSSPAVTKRIVARAKLEKVI